MLASLELRSLSAQAAPLAAPLLQLTQQHAPLHPLPPFRWMLCPFLAWAILVISFYAGEEAAMKGRKVSSAGQHGTSLMTIMSSPAPSRPL